MRKASKRFVDLAQKPSDTVQKFERLRPGMGKDRSPYKCQEPDKTVGTIIGGDGSEWVTVSRGHHAGKLALRQIFGEMLQGTHLHVDEGLLAGGMHHLKNEGAAIASDEMKIIVVLAGQGCSRRLEAIEIASQVHYLGFGGWGDGAIFQEHAADIVAFMHS